MLPTEAPLIDADGHATTLAQIADGKPLILAPGYFQCPNLCGVVRDDLFAALAESGLQPGRDYNVALITIDPTETLADAKYARESVLSRYPDAKFATLTGPKSSLDAVADAAGFKARFDQATRQFLHPAGVVVASPSGRISTYLMGVGYGAKKLAAAVTTPKPTSPPRPSQSTSSASATTPPPANSAPPSWKPSASPA